MSRRTIALCMPRVGDMDSFRDRPTPPLSLVHAATLLVDDHDVRVVDQRVERHWRRALDALLARDPIAVGLTTMTGSMIRHALEIARYVRARSNVPLVWGGTHVSLQPRQAMRSDLVDHVVVGEGERSFPRLVQRLQQGRSAVGIPGVWTRHDGAVVEAQSAPPMDFGELPPAPYHLVDMDRYAYSYGGLRFFDYLSSRGCPHHCTYCYNSVLNTSRWSPRPAVSVLDELATLRRQHDFDVVYFLDDNFFIDRDRAWEILRAMPSLGLQYALQGVDIQSIEAMSDAQLDELESTGLCKITLGIETGSDRLRREIGKWGDTAAVRRNLARLADRRFQVLTSFIIGFPDESDEELRQTVRLVLELQALGENFRLPQLFNYTPIQGTAMANDLVEAGYRFPAQLEDWASIEWDVSRLHADDPARRRRLEAMAFLSKFVDRKDLDYGSRSVVAGLYRLYRPLALARLRAGAHRFLPERHLYRALKELA